MRRVVTLVLMVFAPLSVHVPKMRHVFGFDLALGRVIVWPRRCIRLHESCTSFVLFDRCINAWPGASIDIHTVPLFAIIRRILFPTKYYIWLLSIPR